MVEVDPRSVKLASELDEWEVKQFLDAITALIAPVETLYFWRFQPHDPGDEMVLKAAVNGGALAIVNLRDFGETPRKFGIELLLPRDALRRLSQ